MTSEFGARGFPLADDLFLVALNDATGRPRLQSRILGLGLAGGLLAELVLGEHLTVHEGRLYPRARQPPPDALAHATEEQVRAEPHHPLSTWIAYLAQSAEASVARRLELARWIRRHETRRLLAKPNVIYQPTDRAEAPWRAVRLARLLAERQVLGWQDATLAALVAATGLHHFVLLDAERSVSEHLDALAASLPGPLAEITATVAALSGQVVLTRR